MKLNKLIAVAVSLCLMQGCMVFVPIEHAAAEEPIVSEGDGSAGSSNPAGSGEGQGQPSEDGGGAAGGQATENPGLPTGGGADTGGTAKEGGSASAAGNDPLPSEEAEGPDASSPNDQEKADGASDSDAFDPEGDLRSRAFSLAAAAPLAKGTYVIRTDLSLTKVFDIAGGSVANGANVQLYESNMTAAQKFKVDYDSKGYYTFTNEKSGKVLDVAGGSKASGSNVWQYSPNGTLAQKWVVEKNSNGSYTLKSALNTALALDIQGGSSNDRANVQVHTANGTNAQKLRFMPTPVQITGGKTLETGIYEIASGLDGNKVLDIQAGSFANGAALQLHGKNGTLAQRFMITHYDDGYYSIRALNSGKALDVVGGNLVPTTKVQQWSFNSAIANQKWAIRYDAVGKTYTIVSKANGLALDVSGASTANGTRIQTYGSNSTNAQKWKVNKIDNLIGNGVYSLASRLDAGKYVDVVGGSNGDGASIHLYSGNGTAAQKFAFSKVDGQANVYTIEALCSGKRLTAEGKKVVQRTANNNSAAQRWKASMNGSGGLQLKNMSTDTVLDVSGAGTWDGCSIGVYGANGTAAQGFLPVGTSAVSAGFYEIVNAGSSRALDVAGGSFAAGANVQIYQPNNTGAQRWMLQEAGGGWFYVVNAQSKQALDVHNATAKPGTNVKQWHLSNNNAQKWRFEYASGSYSIVSACGNLYLEAADNGNVQIATKSGSGKQRWVLSARASWPSGNGGLDQRLSHVIGEVGTDGDVLRKCFNYVAAFGYRTGSLYPEGDWSVPFAIEMYDNRSGNCYRYAALFCWLARACGYDANVASGWIPSYSLGQAAHGWVEIRIGGQIYVCDPNMAHSHPSRNWFLVTYANAPVDYHKW